MDDYKERTFLVLPDEIKYNKHRYKRFFLMGGVIRNMKYNWTEGNRPQQHRKQEKGL